MNTTMQSRNWTVLERVSFRFFFIFFLLYILLYNSEVFPFVDKIVAIVDQPLRTVCIWVAKNIFGTTKELFTWPIDAFDTTSHYVLTFTYASVATIGALAWSLLDRRRENYSTLYYWLTTAIRFFVGLALISYGLAKLYKTQFPDPSIYLLNFPYGDFHPQSLVWNFFGFSKGYNIFIGIVEVASGLLLFRRTTAFGALISIVTLLNVVAVNYFFFVTVKLFSTMLLLMAVFLAAPYIKGVFDFFFKTSTKALFFQARPVFKNKFTSVGLTAFKYIFLIYTLGIMFIEKGELLQMTKKESTVENTPIYGYFEVDQFIHNGNELTHFRDSIRWKNFMLVSSIASITKMNGERSRYEYDIDTINHQVKLRDTRDSTMIYFLEYQDLDSLYKFDIVMEEDTLEMEVTRRTKEDYRLTSSDFYWTLD